MGVVNSAEWRGTEVPSTNGHGTAAGVARMYAALLDPGHVLSVDLVAEATSSQSQGYCPILHEDVTFGLGFSRPFLAAPSGRSLGASATSGREGPWGSADPRSRIAFGYVMNRVIPRWQSTRDRRVNRTRCTTHSDPQGGVLHDAATPVARSGRRTPVRGPVAGRWGDRRRPDARALTFGGRVVGDGRPRRGGDMTGAAMAMPTRHVEMRYEGTKAQAD